MVKRKRNSSITIKTKYNFEPRKISLEYQQLGYHMPLHPQKEKSFKFIEIQTECSSNKHSNEQKETAPTILNLPKPSAPRLLLHKKNTQITSTKKKLK